jgi:transcriptional regulator with XRE-family HTH domain
MASDPARTPQQEAALWGSALRLLRESTRDARQRKLTQDAAATAYGVKRQAWNNYEQGERLVILQREVQDRLVEAIGRTWDELKALRDELAGEASSQGGERRTFAGDNVQELAVLGRVKAGDQGPQIYDAGEGPESTVDVSWMFGPSARTLRAAGDSMTGYVESGELVVYDVNPHVWPRRGDGVVVELVNGELYVKEYVQSAQGVLKLRQRFPDEELSFPMASVKGVYKVRMRGVG